MHAVTKWAAALCMAAVGCTALQMLAPKKGLGRLFKMITVAFFICCMISPLLSMKSILSLQIDSLPQEVSTDVLEERVYKQFQQQVNTSLQQVAEQTLKNYGISLRKVHVNMDTREDGGIYISNITLYLDKQSQSKAAAAKQVMEQRLGVKVEVKTMME